jgi:hypothetical protein
MKCTFRNEVFAHIACLVHNSHKDTSKFTIAQMHNEQTKAFDYNTALSHIQTCIQQQMCTTLDLTSACVNSYHCQPTTIHKCYH